MTINGLIRAQGRPVLSPGEFAELQALIDEHPEWNRHRIARELCQAWEWCICAGQGKTFAARTFLLTLEEGHQLRLPPVREHYRQQPWGIRMESSSLPVPTRQIEGSLEVLQPLDWEVCSYQTDQRQRALGLLRPFHDLGCNRPVGTQLLYLAKDAQGRELAVHRVGAAGWQCAPRDASSVWGYPLSSDFGCQLSPGGAR